MVPMRILAILELSAGNSHRMDGLPTFQPCKRAEHQFKKEILKFLFLTYLNYDCSTDVQFCGVNWSAQAVKGGQKCPLTHKDNIAYAPKLKGWTIIVQGII